MSPRWSSRGAPSSTSSSTTGAPLDGRVHGGYGGVIGSFGHSGQGGGGSMLPQSPSGGGFNATTRLRALHRGLDWQREVEVFIALKGAGCGGASRCWGANRRGCGCQCATASYSSVGGTGHGDSTSWSEGAGLAATDPGLWGWGPSSRFWGRGAGLRVVSGCGPGGVRGAVGGPPSLWGVLSLSWGWVEGGGGGCCQWGGGGSLSISGSGDAGGSGGEGSADDRPPSLFGWVGYPTIWYRLGCGTPLLLALRCI